MDTFAFLLMPGFSAMAFFSAVEPLRVANRLSAKELYRWSLHAPKGDHALASNGMQILASGPVDERSNTLIVCAGFNPMKACNRDMLGLVRRMWRKGATVGAIDTGVFVLAEAGILGREPVTLHWEAALEFAQTYPDIPVSAELYESHARLFTCAGGTAAMDMMLEWISRSHGEALAIAVSEQLIHDRIRKPTDTQRYALPARIGSTKRLVLRGVEVMEGHVGQPLSIDEIADIVGTTRRNLERHFMASLGQSPAQYYRKLRLEIAAKLIADTELVMQDIALASGFGSASVLSRAYKAHFGHAPRGAQTRHLRNRVPACNMMEIG